MMRFVSMQNVQTVTNHVYPTAIMFRKFRTCHLTVENENCRQIDWKIANPDHKQQMNGQVIKSIVVSVFKWQYLSNRNACKNCAFTLYQHLMAVQQHNTNCDKIHAIQRPVIYQTIFEHFIEHIKLHTYIDNITSDNGKFLLQYKHNSRYSLTWFRCNTVWNFLFCFCCCTTIHCELLI